MKVIGLDNQEYPLKLTLTRRETSSQAHAKARQLLKEIFPLDSIFEEVSLPGSKTRVNKRTLTADFFIPSILVMIEVQGEQHYDFVPHFHGEKIKFYKSQRRDEVKEEWCRRNRITLIELPVTENIDEWRTRIENR